MRASPRLAAKKRSATPTKVKPATPKKTAAQKRADDRARRERGKEVSPAADALLTTIFVCEVAGAFLLLVTGNTGYTEVHPIVHEFSWYSAALLFITTHLLVYGAIALVKRLSQTACRELSRRRVREPRGCVT